MNKWLITHQNASNAHVRKYFCIAGKETPKNALDQIQVIGNSNFRAWRRNKEVHNKYQGNHRRSHPWIEDSFKSKLPISYQSTTMDAKSFSSFGVDK